MLFTENNKGLKQRVSVLIYGICEGIRTRVSVSCNNIHVISNVIATNYNASHFIIGGLTRIGSNLNSVVWIAPNPSLQHILYSCKTARGWYRWRHDQILQKLAEVLEAQQGAGPQNITQKVRRSLLTPGCDWNLGVDLDRQLKFTPEITTTFLRPDIILWSLLAKIAILAELTVPREGGMEAAFTRRKDKYTELAAEC